MLQHIRGSVPARTDAAWSARMPNEYRAGPIYRAGLIVSGGMCAGLGISILAALARHHLDYAQWLPASAPTQPAAAMGFAACGLALIGVGFWFPRVTSLLAMVTMSLGITLAAEKLLGLGPLVEILIATNLGVGNWGTIAPNTLLVLMLGATALLLRHAPRWFEMRLWIIAVLGSIIFAIGVVGCVGYMTGVPTYAWHGAPMSFLSVICSSVMGLGIVMSACRYSELDEYGTPRWFSLVVFSGSVAINVSAGVALFCQLGQTWKWVQLTGLMPMLIVNAMLSVVAARHAWREGHSGNTSIPLRT